MGLPPAVRASSGRLGPENGPRRALDEMASAVSAPLAVAIGRDVHARYSKLLLLPLDDLPEEAALLFGAMYD